MFQIAWRNVWRNPGRSLVVIGSIILGIWALTFLLAFMNGFLLGYTENAIKYEYSNIQIHHPEFKKDYEIKYAVKNVPGILEELGNMKQVEASSTRSLVNGMVGSARKSTGVLIIGIEPEAEALVTDLENLVEHGTYFSEIKRNPVVLGEKLAAELQVKLRSKVVLTFHDIHGEITQGAFRVEGILNANSLKLNQGTAFVRKSDLNRMMDIGETVHEIAIVTVPDADETMIKEELSRKFPEMLSETWIEVAPELNFMLQWVKSTLRILIAIIMIALVFGIINTMLMAVLERYKELGMLMAIGMNKTRIFLMIVIETIYLGFVGGPLGLLAGYGTVQYLGRTGIDLSDFSEGLRQYGWDTILYPDLESGLIIEIAIAVIITAFIGALYPAYKAIKLNPIEALHTN